VSRLAALKAGTNNRKTVKFPGTDQDVVMRVLSNAEVQEAEFGTEKHFRQQGIQYYEATVEAYEKEKTVRMLHSALRDPEDETKTFAASVAELRAMTTQAEKDALVMELNDFMAECSPDMEALSEEEFGEIVEMVKKRPEETVSSLSSMSLLRRLAISLASRPASSRTGSGSTS
jgi:hypothetical protein